MNNSPRRDVEGHLMTRVIFLERRDLERVGIYLFEMKECNNCEI